METSSRTKGSGYAWVISAGGFGTQIVALLFTMVWGYCIAYVCKDFGVERTDLALASACYGTLYAGMSFMWGWIADKFGVRWTMTVSAALTGVASLAFAFAVNSPMQAIMCYAAIGVFVGGCGSAVLPKLISAWFHSSARGKGMIIAGWGGSVVSLSGGIIFPQIILNSGWRGCFTACGVVALIVAVLIFVLVRDTPAKKDTVPFGMPESEVDSYLDSAANKTELSDEEKSLIKERNHALLIEVLKQPITWIAGIVQILFQFYMMANATYRTAAIISSGFSVVEAGLFCTILTVTMMVSQFIGGFLTDRFPRKYVIAVMFIIGGAIYAGLQIPFSQSNVFVLYAYGAFMGLFMGVAPLMYNQLAELYQPHLRGTGPGVVGTIALLGRFGGPMLAAMFITMVGSDGGFVYFVGISLIIAGIVALLAFPKTGGHVGDPMAEQEKEQEAAAMAKAGTATQD